MHIGSQEWTLSASVALESIEFQLTLVALKSFFDSTLHALPLNDIFKDKLDLLEGDNFLQ